MFLLDLIVLLNRTPLTLHLTATLDPVGHLPGDPLRKRLYLGRGACPLTELSLLQTQQDQNLSLTRFERLEGFANESPWPMYLNACKCHGLGLHSYPGFVAADE